MGSRERKRAERQKRKTRSAEREATAHELADEAISPTTSNGSEAGTDLTSRAESASERKNREAREALEPLEEGERPTVVTVAAVICNVLVILSAAGYALWDVLGPDEPRPDLTIVVVNDDGGSIFAMLEQGAPEHAHAFERLFGTPHGVDLGSLCAATRTPHWKVDNLAELEHALANPNGGIEVVEAVVSRRDRRSLDERIRALRP